MRSSKRHVIPLSLIFLLKCFAKSIFISGLLTSAKFYSRLLSFGGFNSFETPRRYVYLHSNVCAITIIFFFSNARFASYIKNKTQKRKQRVKVNREDISLAVMLQQIALNNIFDTIYTCTLCIVIRPTSAIFQWQSWVPRDNLHWTSKRWCWRQLKCDIRDPPLQSGHPKWHREMEKCQLPYWVGCWGENPERRDKMRSSTWRNK